MILTNKKGEQSVPLTAPPRHATLLALNMGTITLQIEMFPKNNQSQSKATKDRNKERKAIN